MALNVDYRPQSLDEVVGNEALVKSLKGVLRRDKPKQTYLFTGPSGCGKTTLARIIKDELDCSTFDYHYFNASNTRGIDTVREVVQNLQMAPMRGQVKVYVFDECHQLTRPAQEALLKDTEDPPPGVFFIFCTTEPEKLQSTFKRRAFQGQVQKLRRAEMTNLLNDILAAEETEAVEAKDEDRLAKLETFPDELVSKIVDASDGSPGQALKLLDQIVELDDFSIAEKSLQSIFADEASVLEISRTLCDERLKFDTKWGKVRPALEALQQEPEQIRHGILTYLSKVAGSVAHRPDVMEMISYFKESTFYSGKAGLQLMCYQSCFVGEVDE